MSLPGPEIDISALVPAHYAMYRPVIAEVLSHFLQRLAPYRLEEIGAEQSRLPPTADLPRRFTSLVRCCPTLHKLAQVMARDRRLDPLLRRRLQSLESMPPGPVPRSVRERLDAELDQFDRTGIRVSPHALAEASVALVVPFSHPEGLGDGAFEGVFKVLKPGIEQRLEEELAIWSDLGAYIDGRCADYGLPEIHYEETLTSVGRLLAGEVLLDREQAHMREAAVLYGGPAVVVPRILSFCTPRLTAMERVTGRKVTETGGLSVHRRRELADRIIASLVAGPLWRPEDPSLFHADPHAGNLFRRSDGALVILDWSLVGRLGKCEREQMVQMLLGAVRLDRAAIACAIRALAIGDVRETPLLDAVDRAVADLAAGRPPGFRWLLDLLDEVALGAGARFDQSLVFYRKSILTLEGVLADIVPDDRLGQVMSMTGVVQVLSESLFRGWAPPGSRAFGSHLSNLDLLRLCWAFPEASLRLWSRWLDAGPSGAP